ncbi:fish-egg lectin-like [Anomaloglossus baeobatrachus]|uniref:fish-egg lectin-like n=1 Tax=Anomaloglossus baeobatrachus TaxID=238106 RepID=UPI003F4F7CF0
MIQILGLLLLCSGAATAADRLCIVIDGRLKQVDAGNGQVYGVNDDDNIYQWMGSGWRQFPGQLMHVTVGPAGVWGVNKFQSIYKYKDDNWMRVSGRLKQIDAGGDKFLSGVNGMDDIFCANQDQTISNSTNVAYNDIDGSLKYYSCGPYGCWGVNAIDNIYYRHNVQPTYCKGSRWQHIDGRLKMVEVGSDGSVYGVNSNGKVYKREGITDGNPIGTSWTQLKFYDVMKHVSYDQGNLWLITKKGIIYKCKVDGSADQSCY